MRKKHLVLLAVIVFVFPVFQGIASRKCCNGTIPLIGTNANAAENVTTATASSVKLPSMIDLGRTKCIPCKMMAPVLEELKKEYADVLRIEFIDVGDHPDAADQYHIRGIPTQIFFDSSGRELGRHLGYISKEQILDTFKKFGIDVDKKASQKIK